nr:MAG TPA: tail protein [Bacteriophage sp.]
MLTFYNEHGEGFGAQVEFTVKNAVNGERSVSGTIISNDNVLFGIDRGWKFELDGEFFTIVYAKPRDEGQNLSVSFDAVHQFFYDFEHSNCYTEFNGSHRFEVYIEAIFKDSGYRYQIEPSVRVNSIRKENFGNAKRLGMFKDIIKAAGLEFSVSGKVVLITKKIGSDLSTVVRKNFNMNELVIEKNINKFITYKRGLGAWKDEEDHSKGRYTSEYESPLASIYGRIEGEPVTDERYKDTGKLLERLKFEVDNSYSISVQLDMEDLTRAGYQYTQPRAGDYIMAINETIGFREKIRIVSFESSYDVTGRLINHKVTCNDIGSVQKQISSESSIIRSVGQSKEFAESALAVATRALVSADGKNTVYYGATKPKDEPIGTIKRGDILYLTAGENTEMYIWNGAEWELKKLKLDTSDLEKKFDKVKKATEQANEENKRRTDEAFKKAGASEDLAKEAKKIADDNVRNLNTFKVTAERAQTQLSQDVTNFKNEYGSKMLEVTQTTDGIKTKIGEITSFIDKDGQRQEELKRYAREETANQTSAIRETISRDFVAKSTFTETVEGTNQRFEALTRENETKLAEYKQGIDGRIADITSQVAGKVNEADFQRVRETAQLYERILGTNDSNVSTNIARMALTSDLFNVEVGKKFSNLTNLFYAPTKIPKYISSVATDKHLERVSFGDHDGIRINYTDSMTGWLGVRFPLTKKFVKQGEGLGYRIEISVDKVPKDGRVLIQLLDNTPNLGMYYNSQILLTKTGNQVFTGYLDIPYTGELNEYSIRFTLTSPGNIIIHKPMVIDKRLIPEQFVDSTDYNSEYTRTTMTILKDSFAVKTLNSNGDVLSALNLATGGASLEVGKNKLVVTPETTFIANGTIKKAMIADAQIGTAQIGEIDASKARIINISAKNVVMDSAMANKMVSSDLFTDALAAKTAFINKLRSSVVTANLLEGFKGRIGGFQIGTHDKDPSVYWLTGTNQFDVGMSNGSSAWGQTALWVNWGNNWNKAGDYAWFVKRTGEMFCYNKAQFWNTPVVHGNLIVTGHIFYDNRQSGGKAGHWVSSENYSRIDPSGGSLYLYYSGGGYDWIPMNKDVSDRRYKHNIEDSKVSALEVINRLKTYSYRKEYDGKIEDISCGIMAQDVQKYAPEAFLENPDGAYSYNTFVLVPYLIKAIQELNQKLEKVNEGRN